MQHLMLRRDVIDACAEGKFAIYPVNTMYDGDIVFALSKGDREGDLNTLGVMAADAVAQGIVRAVKLAVTLGGVPGLGSGK